MPTVDGFVFQEGQDGPFEFLGVYGASKFGQGVEDILVTMCDELSCMPTLYRLFDENVDDKSWDPTIKTPSYAKRWKKFYEDDKDLGSPLYDIMKNGFEKGARLLRKKVETEKLAPEVVQDMFNRAGLDYHMVLIQRVQIEL